MTPQISWTSRGTDIPKLDFARLAAWIEAVAATYGKMARTLNYIFCTDEEIIAVNRQFLSHDFYTDIITFDYCTGSLLRGDIFISLDTVADNARELGTDYSRELLRVIIHGVLHLCGQNDKAPGERELMEAAEDRALEIWDNTTT